MQPPWTPEELEALIPKIEFQLSDFENRHKDARPLPMMTMDESMDLFMRFMGMAGERPLTEPECFMMGQLLGVFLHAVRTETLAEVREMLHVSRGRSKPSSL